MYQKCGVDKDKDILHEINHVLSPSDADKCRAIVEEMEEEGRQTLQLATGARELLAWCRSHGIPTALVTRNTRRTSDRLEELLLERTSVGNDRETTSSTSQQQPHAFDTVIARDDSDFPPKPDPASLRHILREWGVVDIDVSTSVVMVGDSHANDVVYGKAAGATTALLDTGRRYMATETSKDTAIHPDCIVQNLWELSRWLWLNMDIPGSLGTYSPLLKYDTPLVTSKAGQAAVDGDLKTLEQLPTTELFQGCTKTGNTPLIWAANAGHDHIVEYLLQEGSLPSDNNHVDARGYLGATAVSRAACRGHGACLELLAAAGADLDSANDKMQFPLHFAAYKQHLDCIHILLNYGANPYVLDRKGRTPSLDTSNDEIRHVLEEAMMKQSTGITT